MKKLLSVLLCITMLMSGMSVFADTFDELSDILDSSSTGNYACSSKMSVSLDAPIELLELANEALAEEDVYIDLSGIVGSFFNTTIDMDMKMNASKDLKKFVSEIKMKTNLPLVINSNLKITIDMNMDMYINFDATDAENPSFSMIFTIPVYDKYIVIDSAYLMQDEQTAAEMKEFFKMYSEILSQTASFNMELYKDFYTVKKTGSTYTLTMSDEQFKSLMKSLPEIMFDMGLPGMNELTEEEKLEFNVQFAAIMGVIDNFTILGEDGAVSVCTVSGGKVKQIDSSISFDFNIYDIASAFMIMTGDYDTGELNEMLSPLTKENSRIAFTIKETDVYSYDENKTKIAFPTLSEENSYNIFEELYSDNQDDYYDDEEYFVDEYASIYVETTGIPTRTSDGLPYLPLRAVFEQFELDENAIGWESVNGQSVVTVMGTQEIGFNELKITNTKDGRSSVFVDGKEYQDEGAFLSKGVTYISTKLITHLTGYEFYDWSESIYYDYEYCEYRCSYWFEKYSYGEEEITDSDSFVEEEVYELPVVKNDAVPA